LAQISRYFYQDYESFDEKAAKKHLRPVAKQPLMKVLEALEDLEDWQPNSIQNAINSTAEALGIGMGKVGMPLRVAVTGSGNSPSLDVTLALIPKASIVQRINKALEYIENRENS
jgi:glutamyl-tRNA synthetase